MFFSYYSLGYISVSLFNTQLQQENNRTMNGSHNCFYKTHLMTPFYLHYCFIGYIHFFGCAVEQGAEK